MQLGGDPAELRATARRVRSWADELQSGAERAGAAADVRWTSLSADRFRERLSERGADVSRLAERVRSVADELERLAATLEDRQHHLAGAAARAGLTVGALWAAAAQQGIEIVDAAEGAVDRLRP